MGSKRRKGSRKVHAVPKRQEDKAFFQQTIRDVEVADAEDGLLLSQESNSVAAASQQHHQQGLVVEPTPPEPSDEDHQIDAAPKPPQPPPPPQPATQAAEERQQQQPPGDSSSAARPSLDAPSSVLTSSEASLDLIGLSQEEGDAAVAATEQRFSQSLLPEPAGPAPGRGGELRKRKRDSIAGAGVGESPQRWKSVTRASLPPPQPRMSEAADAAEFVLVPEEEDVDTVRADTPLLEALPWEAEERQYTEEDLAVVVPFADPGSGVLEPLGENFFTNVSMDHIYEALCHCARFGLSNLPLLATVQSDALGERMREEGMARQQFAVAYLAFLVADSCDVLQDSPMALPGWLPEAIGATLPLGSGLVAQLRALHPRCHCCRVKWCARYMAEAGGEGDTPFPAASNPFLRTVISLRSDADARRRTHATGCPQVALG